MTRHDLTFFSDSTPLSAWHFPARTDNFTGPAGTPVVVMAHGLGGTKDSGLAPFAEAFADAGLHVVAFDYRGFGGSAGTPRQHVDPRAQILDYHAAVAAARRLAGVDPARIALWGASLSGGHVLSVAAQDHDIAAVMSLTPLVDGPAAGARAARHHRPSTLARSTLKGLRSSIAGTLGRRPVTIPVVGRPGELAALNLDGYFEDYTALAGPTWRNEIDADVVLRLGTYRPGKDATRIVCPLLVQIADFDRSAPPDAAAHAAFRARAEVRHHPCDHFDVWPGKPWHSTVVASQIDFLTRSLQIPRSSPTVETR